MIGDQMPIGQKVADGPFSPCFSSPKLRNAPRTRVTSKNRAVFGDFYLYLSFAILSLF